MVRKALLAGFFLAGSSAPCLAAVLVDNGTTGLQNGFLLGDGQDLATSFVLNDTYSLTSFSVYANAFNGPSTATFSIASPDVVTGLPGATLFSSSFALGSTPSLQGTSFGPNTLRPGTYWITGTASARSTWWGPAPNGNQSAFTSGGVWNYDAASKLTLLLNGDRVSAAVPEPTTWALMLLGFGAIGLGMRGRPRRTVRYDFA